MVNFVGFKSQHDLENSKFNGAWVSFCENSEWISTFRGWEHEVQALVDVCQKFNDQNGKKSSRAAHMGNLSV
jgi:salicylate hydroxylase